MIGDRRNRVLIVEDDPSIRRMLVVSLGREGYRTAEASNGREGLDVLRAGHVDLVVLDLMMPEVTGHQALAERAADPELRKIPSSSSPPIEATMLERSSMAGSTHCCQSRSTLKRFTLW